MATVKQILSLENAGADIVRVTVPTLEATDAFEKIVRLMKENNFGYGAINHPVDRDPVCGYVGVIKDVCPGCGRRAFEGVSQEKLKNLNCGSCNK